MTTSYSGRAVLDILATIAWATGQTVHHATNGYQASRRFYRAQIATGLLQRNTLALVDEAQLGFDLALEAGDQFLNDWQELSDAFRGLLGVVLAYVWICTYELGLVAARAAGAAYGLHRALTSSTAIALISETESAICSHAVILWDAVQRWVVLLGSGCDRALEVAFCLA